jgi:hypothetical protein
MLRKKGYFGFSERGERRERREEREGVRERRATPHIRWE